MARAYFRACKRINLCVQDPRLPPPTHHDFCALLCLGRESSIDQDVVSRSRKLLFRVHEHDDLSGSTRLDFRDGLVPPVPPPADWDDWTLGKRGSLAIKQCAKWWIKEPTPFVSLTRSVGWAIREACVRHHEPLEQSQLCQAARWTAPIRQRIVEVIFIDAEALLSACPRNGSLFDAASLVEGSALSETYRREALLFAQHSDELLVLGKVPASAIVARIPITELLPHLPSYFLSSVGEAPSENTQQTLVPGLYSRVATPPSSPTRKGETKQTIHKHRVIYNAMISNLVSEGHLKVDEHLQSALDFALCVLPSSTIHQPTHPYSQNWVTAFTKVAMSILTWLIKWDGWPYDANGSEPSAPTMLVYLEQSVQLRASMIFLLEHFATPPSRNAGQRIIALCIATNHYTCAHQSFAEYQFGVSVADWWADEAERRFSGETDADDVDELVRDFTAMPAQL